MTDVLLNYVMKVSKTIPIASPSLQYLQNVLVVTKPVAEDTPKTVVRVTSAAEIANVTDAMGLVALLDYGKSYFYVLPSADLNLANPAITNINEYKYFTILIDEAFTEEELANLVLPIDFKGVVGGASSDDKFVESQNKINNYAWFYQKEGNEGQNMYAAFGSLLSKPKNRWSNQQYLKLPVDDGITQLGTADAMFDLRANFALTGEQYGTRLALFCVGSDSGEVNAIVAPYIYEELTVLLQGDALTWINLNEPDYTVANAALLEQYLQKRIDQYIADGTISGGSITISVGNEQFIMVGNIQINKPSALWRIKANMIEGSLN